jgi:hypothetical protein
MKKFIKSISKCLDNLLSVDCTKITKSNKFVPLNYGMGL